MAINEAVTIGDADICFDASVSPVNNALAFSGGLVFWMQDRGNLYPLLHNAAGMASLQRLKDNKLLVLVNWRKAASLKAGADVVNSFRLTLKGDKISVYFNNEPWYADRSGSQPKGGGSFGFIYFSEPSAPNTWTFAGLKVTDPSK